MLDKGHYFKLLLLIILALIVQQKKKKPNKPLYVTFFSGTWMTQKEYQLSSNNRFIP